MRRSLTSRVVMAMLAFALAAVVPGPALAAGTVYAGGGIGDGGPATAAALQFPTGAAYVPGDGIYVTEMVRGRVRRIDGSGTISTFAGGGSSDADGVPVAQSALYYPNDIVALATGQLYIAQSYGVFRVDQYGIMTRYAGFAYPDGGDGRPANKASLNGVAAIALSSSGELYIAEAASHRIRKVDHAGIISTVAGGNGNGFAGDGGAAIAAKLSYPSDIAFDPAGNLYIADLGNSRVRRVTPGGSITTFAGSGQRGPSIAGVPATLTPFDGPLGVEADPSGDVYISDAYNNLVHRVDAVTGIIRPFAGNRVGFKQSGDGGPALAAAITQPGHLSWDGSGRLLIMANVLVRAVAPDGTISTIAGNGRFEAGGDGRAATNAEMRNPTALAVDAAGNTYIADTEPNLIRRVNAAGEIESIGTTPTESIDGLPGVFKPEGVAVAPDGTVFASDTRRHRVVRLSGSYWVPAVATGSIQGTGDVGRTGDGGPAITTTLSTPKGLAFGPDGNLYIADFGNNRVRMVDRHGVITTVAGNGTIGSGGDGGPATAASLNGPSAIAFMADGSMLIADSFNNRIRRVHPNGSISTFSSGLQGPAGIAVSPSGTVAVADRNNDRIVLIPGAPITGLNRPVGVAFTGSSLLVSESGANMVKSFAGVL